MLELMLTRPDDRTSLVQMARGAASSWSSTSCTPTAAGRAPTSRCWSAGCARRAERSEPAVRRHVGDDGQRGQRRRAPSRSSPSRDARLFGTPVRPENVIGETLVRATGEAPDDRARPTRLTSPEAPRAYAELIADPLARGSRRASASARRGRAGWSAPRPPRSRTAATELAERSGLDAEPVRRGDPDHAAARVGGAPSGHRPPAVRVPAAPVPVQGRHGLRHARDPSTPSPHPRLPARAARHRRQVLLPLAFCRECGQEYLTVVAHGEADGEIVRYDVPPRHQRDRRRRVEDGYLLRRPRPTRGRPTIRGGDRRTGGCPTPGWSSTTRGHEVVREVLPRTGCRGRSPSTRTATRDAASCRPRSSPRRSASACTAA